jgi:photosystem II stability/assembly factor-like uncharacterized protein
MSVYFLDADTGFVVGSYWGGISILKTLNGGQQWNSQQTGTGSVLKAVFFPDNNTGYTVGNDGIILKTTDGGSEWISQESMTSLTLRAVFFTDVNTGYIVGGDYSLGASVILKTINGGSKWIQQDPGTTSNLFSVYFTNTDTGYIVGYNGTILKTTDGGLNWLGQVSGTTASLGSVYFPTRDTGYIVGYNGTILKTTNGGGLPVGIGDEPSAIKSLNISPNPATANITIELPSTVPVNNTILSIYNINAQKVISRRITEPETVIDISTLPGGVYFARLTNERTLMAGKFIKH